MKKLQKLYSYITIIKYVEDPSEKKPKTLKGIHDAVNNQLINNSDTEGVSERTIQRYISDIKKYLRIEIEFNSKEDKYEIKEKGEDEILHYIEAANIVYTMQNIHSVKKHIAFDKRKVKKGIEHYFDIIKAIEKNKKIEFGHINYFDNVKKDKIVTPLGLKEFKGFWYLIAKEKDSDVIKAYGLDRITYLKESPYDNAESIEDFDINEYYKDCYGIVKFPDEKPQEIKIWATPIKAAYYRANPLHESQKEIEKNDTHSIFSIFVCLTYDLQQEIRSHGENEVKIIEPKNAMDKVRYK